MVRPVLLRLRHRHRRLPPVAPTAVTVAMDKMATK